MKKLFTLLFLLAFCLSLSVQAQGNPPTPCVVTERIPITYYIPVYIGGYGYLMVPQTTYIYVTHPGATDQYGNCLPQQ